MICESSARNDISDAYLSIDGYQLVVRQDGRDTMGGKCRGLLIYVKDGIWQILRKRTIEVLDGIIRKFAQIYKVCENT